LFVLIILHSSYIAYGTSASFSTISITLMWALASSLNCTILLAVPPSSKAPRFSGSLPSYWYSRVAATTGPHPLCSPSSRYPSCATGRTPPSTRVYAVSPIVIPPRACQQRLGTSPRVEFLTVRPLDPSKSESGLCSRLCVDAWRLLCLSLSSSRSSSSNARAVYLVCCGSSRIISLCIGHLARAGVLIALLCVSCVYFRLLLICDVESALSSLAVMVVSLVGCACDLRVGFVMSCRVFPTAGRRGGGPRRPCRALSVAVEKS
jgi:hypothetical protein